MVVLPHPHVVLAGTSETLRVGKVLAAGRNYSHHIAEMYGVAELPLVLFAKLPTAIVHDGATVRLPRGLGAVHHEVELVAVLGDRGRRIPQARALDHVLGFAVGIDLTLRDVQSEARRRGEPWTLAKGFDGAAPVSAVALRDTVGDGSGLAIHLDVNGRRRQQGNTSDMVHTVAELVAHASRWITLEQGDLIFTGTPSGVGPVLPGDVLVAAIERVGTLTVRFEQDPED